MRSKREEELREEKLFVGCGEGGCEGMGLLLSNVGELLAFIIKSFLNIII